MTCKIGDFLHLPYVHGWKHFKKAFSCPSKNDGKVQEVAKKFLCGCEKTKKVSLCGRIKHTISGLLLCCPLLNIFVHGIYKGLIEEQNKYVKECNDKLALLEPIVEEFQKNLAKEDKDFDSFREFEKSMDLLIFYSRDYSVRLTQKNLKEGEEFGPYVLEVQKQIAVVEKKVTENPAYDLTNLRKEIKVCIDKLGRFANYPIHYQKGLLTNMLKYNK